MLKLLPIILTFILVSCGDSHIVNELSSKTDALESECGLYFQSEDLCLEMTWETKPTADTTGSMILTFTAGKNSGVLVTPKNDPFVVLWMTSMGHGSSPVTMEFIGPGKFRARDVFFIMPGPWDIKYQLKNQNDVIEETTQEIMI